MATSEAYKEGMKHYRSYGDDLSSCPYELGSKEYEDFSAGFCQAMKRCDAGRARNSAGRDMWSIREELEKARREKLEKEKSEREMERKRKKYLRESRGEY